MATRDPEAPPGDVRLRDVVEDDLPILFEHQWDPDANRMAAFPARDRDAFMAHWHRILRNEANICKTVLVDGRVAGNVVCFERSGLWEVGYWIGRDHWGKGVATRALSAFLQVVTTRPLYGAVAKHNLASIRVLDKCGFEVSDDHSDATDASDDVEMLLMKLEA